MQCGTITVIVSVSNAQFLLFSKLHCVSRIYSDHIKILSKRMFQIAAKVVRRMASTRRFWWFLFVLISLKCMPWLQPFVQSKLGREYWSKWLINWPFFHFKFNPILIFWHFTLVHSCKCLKMTCQMKRKFRSPDHLFELAWQLFFSGLNRQKKMKWNEMNVHDTRAHVGYN